MDLDGDIDVVMSRDADEPKGRRKLLTVPADTVYNSPSRHVAMRGAKKRLLENPGKQSPYRYVQYSHLSI